MVFNFLVMKALRNVLFCGTNNYSQLCYNNCFQVLNMSLSLYIWLRMTFNKFLPHNSIHLLAKHGKKFRLILCVCVIVVPSLILYMTSVLSAFSLSIYVLLKAFFRVLFRRIKWILGNSYTFTHTHSVKMFILSFLYFFVLYLLHK